MRIDPDTCRDPELLAAEVRRLKNVLAADDPWLTDAEREAVHYFAALTVSPRQDDSSQAAILRSLLDRTDTGEK